jgi:uncharacterized protein (DUF1810 family)
MTSDDPYDLDRFLKAQRPVFETVIAELQAGRKRSHWMWFIFPQLSGLGRSEMAEFYGIDSLAEARTYLDHAILGERLRRCAGIVATSEETSLHAIFGEPDDSKFVSSMTLFALADDREDGVFRQALARFCDGRLDERTVALLQSA